jgi:hypothetical protein
MKQFAGDFNLPVVDGLPVVDETAAKRLATSRVVLDDQWASHPSTEERVLHLKRLDILSENTTESAWVVFREVERLQQAMTDFIYRSAVHKGEPIILDEQAFRDRYELETIPYTFPKLYQGYFNNRPMTEVDPSRSLVRDAGRLSDILTSETLQLPRQLEVLANDIQLMETVRDKANGVRTFEFNGKRYPQSQAEAILQQLRQEKEQAAAALAYADNRIYALTFHAAEQRGSLQVWQEKFSSWLNLERMALETHSYYEDILKIVQPAYEQELTLDSAHSIQNYLAANEQKGKDWILTLLQRPDLSFINNEEQNILSQYATCNLIYFDAKAGFNSENLSLCLRATSLLQYVYGQLSVRAKKDYLQWQAEMLQ